MRESYSEEYKMTTKTKAKGPKVNYLVCVNSESYSEVALHFTCSLARQNNGSVIILHVIEPNDYQTIGSVANKIREEQTAESEALLKELAGKVKEWSGITPVLVMREGLIENEIIALIEEDRTINMLVAGTAPETSVKSKILPPLVAAIGRKLNIPMLIVPGNLTDKQIEDLT